MRARLVSEMEMAQKLAIGNKNITVERLNSKQQEIFSERLKSDITRHAGTIGKVTVVGTSVREVEKLLIQCLSERSPYRVK